jgi:hypothetical protein
LSEFSDKPVLIVTNQLKLAAFDVKTFPFAIEYHMPGALIADRTTPEARARPDHQVSYMVSAGAGDLRLAARRVLHENKLRVLIFLFILVNLGAILALLVHRAWRARRIER